METKVILVIEKVEGKKIVFTVCDGKPLERTFGIEFECIFEAIGELERMNGRKFNADTDMYDDLQVVYQPEFGDDDDLKRPNGEELWSYHVYHDYHNAQSEFPDRKIIAYSIHDIENPYIVDYVEDKRENDLYKEVEHWLRSEIFPAIGMDAPENMHKLVSFIQEDVQETADPENYHSGDFGIAFRRFIETVGLDGSIVDKCGTVIDIDDDVMALNVENDIEFKGMVVGFKNRDFVIVVDQEDNYFDIEPNNIEVL